MDRINVFEGSRRIALALKVAWLLCVAIVSQLQSPFGGYALAFAAGGWLTLSVLQTLIGWVVRGFLEIPFGHNRRPDAC